MICSSPETFVDHGITTTLKPVAKTLRQLFRQMSGVRRNERNRIAIDVSGLEAKSVKYGSSTSLCNHEEARLVVELVTEVLAYEPTFDPKDKDKFARVLPSNIGIISGCKGQMRLIWSLLQQAGNEIVEIKTFYFITVIGVGGQSM
ncbi:uncharacterized protein EKO05_0006735 [Ascochyta rabiei]|nr:uncharacterized protein EKO05_0006735 [Ascochyta rabiei]UPX16327.1 hypothetical protein EKO05_0006735 [Ascochyta rabiei]